MDDVGAPNYLFSKVKRHVEDRRRDVYAKNFVTDHGSPKKKTTSRGSYPEEATYFADPIAVRVVADLLVPPSSTCVKTWSLSKFVSASCTRCR